MPGLNRVLCARNSHGNEAVVSFFYLFMYLWLLPVRNLLMRWIHLLNWNCCQERFNNLAEFFDIPILLFLSRSLCFFSFRNSALKCSFCSDKGDENLKEIFQKGGKQNCSLTPICSSACDLSVDIFPSKFSAPFIVRKNIWILKCSQVRETVSLAASPVTVESLFGDW